MIVYIVRLWSKEFTMRGFSTQQAYNLLVMAALYSLLYLVVRFMNAVDYKVNAVLFWYFTVLGMLVEALVVAFNCVYEYKGWVEFAAVTKVVSLSTHLLVATIFWFMVWVCDRKFYDEERKAFSKVTFLFNGSWWWQQQWPLCVSSPWICYLLLLSALARLKGPFVLSCSTK
jgi:hypothetical protein